VDMRTQMGKIAVVVGLTLLLVSCGGAGTGTPVVSGSAGGSVPALNNVVVVVLENQDYSSIIGNPNMPFLNGLANSNALATQYFTNTHPSIKNYFMLTTKKTITNDNSFNGTISTNNITHELTNTEKN